jgi:hypothetical protein
VLSKKALNESGRRQKKMELSGLILLIGTTTTPITIAFPDWFYFVFSFGVVVFIFWAGVSWCKVQEICKEFPKIRRALDLISQSLLSHKWIDAHIYVSSGSPLHLTETGRKMLADSGFEEFYNANKEYLFSYITSQKPKSPADVETTAKDAMFYLNPKTTPKMELIENFAYNNGKPTADVLFAYSIEVRDRYLKEHPDIK